MRRLFFALTLIACTSFAVSAQLLKYVAGEYNDMVYLPTAGKVYAVTTPTSVNGNSICRIDPTTSQVEVCYGIGSNPVVIAATDSEQYLYVGFRGVNRVKRFNLQTETIDLDFSTGGEGDFLGPFYVEELITLRGSDDAIAVSLRNLCCSPRHEGVAVFDNGVRRANVTPGHTGSNTIARTDSDSRIIGYNNETTDFNIRPMNLSASGLSVLGEYAGFSGFGVRVLYDDSRLYATNGTVMDLENGIPTLAGEFPLADFRPFDGLWFEPLAEENKVAAIGYADNGQLLLKVFEEDNFTEVSKLELGSVPFSNRDVELLLELSSTGDRFAVLLGTSIGTINNCQSEDESIPPAYTGPTSICRFDTLTLVAPQAVLGTGTILWSNGLTGDSIEVTEEGIFSYRILDANGCPGLSSPSFEVERNFNFIESPFISATGGDVICSGGSVTLAVAFTPFNTEVIWSNGQTGPSITVTDPGAYSAVNVSNNGCSSEVSNILVVGQSDQAAPKAPELQVGAMLDTCTTQGVLLETDGNAASYLWEIGGDLLNASANTQLVFPPSFGGGTSSYRVAAISSEGCISSFTEGTVTFHPPLATPSLVYNTGSNTLAASTEGPIQWFYQDELIAETQGRFFQPELSGFYSARRLGEFCTSPVSALINVEITTATEAAAVSERISLYPNPASDLVLLELPSELSSVDYQLTLFEANGRMVKDFPPRMFRGEITINVGELPSGFYLVLLRPLEGGGLVRKRFFVH